jgi:hypothetical protein
VTWFYGGRRHGDVVGVMVGVVVGLNEQYLVRKRHERNMGTDHE